jgi:hypothetical protein
MVLPADLAPEGESGNQGDQEFERVKEAEHLTRVS